MELKILLGVSISLTIGFLIGYLRATIKGIEILDEYSKEVQGLIEDICKGGRNK